MSYIVTAEPSGHTFEAEPSETLLEAGLRAGLNLRHGCANGSCGDCKARLVDGRLSPCRHFDFRFSEIEKQENWFLMCSCRADSDVTIEAREPDKASEMLEQHLTARVRGLELLQDEVMQLIVRAPRSGGLRFLAGQSVAVEVDNLRRAVLPIASCPCDSIQLRFHLRRREDDPFSEFVFDKLRKGDEVELRGPCGDFTLDEESARPLVFIAWESGFAAVASLIDHAIQKNENRCIDLYWLSAIPRGHYLSNYCRAWRDALDDFRYHSIDLEPAGDECIDDVIKRIVRVHVSIGDCDYYMALPADALVSARRVLDQVGVDSEHVHSSLLEHT